MATTLRAQCTSPSAPWVRMPCCWMLACVPSQVPCLLLTAAGPQPDSRYSSQPAPGFGTSTRQNKDSRTNYPGPGTYPQEGGIGPMVESKRETLPRPVFGTATRDQQSKVWLDEELMKTYNGRGSPGPCTYNTGVLRSSRVGIFCTFLHFTCLSRTYR